ncbi:MAG: hypothetical protein JW864_15700 [Spirochaetes bacterium]|nr:hypothetical protein [Spirochaetota bacterium]
MAGKYDQYIFNPPRRQICAQDDGRIVFDGLWTNYNQIGYDFTFGHQFVTKPFVSNNPTHTHNFHEILAWYGGNPEDPEDFGAEIVLYIGEELVKYVFTKPTVVSLPKDMPHCPLEITRVDSPIIQIEMMFIGEGGTREPFFDKDKK